MISYIHGIYISDSDLASISDTSADSQSLASVTGNPVTVTWSNDAESGDVVIVTVIAIYTYDGGTETATATYRLIYNPTDCDMTSDGLDIYMLDTSGHEIANVFSALSSALATDGTSYTMEELAKKFGAEEVEVYSNNTLDYTYYLYQPSNSDYYYIFCAAFADAGMSEAIYSIKYDTSSGYWVYNTSEDGDYSKLDLSAVYIVWYKIDPDSIYDTDSSEDNAGYYHFDVRITGSLNITVTNIEKNETYVTVSKTWDVSDGYEYPDSITVYLTDEEGNLIKASDLESYTGATDDEGYVIAVLTADNNWTYTWQNISLSAGTYYVTDYVDGLTADSTALVIVESGSDSETTYAYTGYIIITNIESVTVTKEDGTTFEISMRCATTTDENTGTGQTYEYQSYYGHYNEVEGSPMGDAPLNIAEGDTVTIVMTYTYWYTDDDGNVYVGSTEYTYIEEITQDNNDCEQKNADEDDDTMNDETKGYDVELTPEEVLTNTDGIAVGLAVALTNTDDEQILTSLTVTKEWSGTAGSEVTVTLYANGEATESTATLSSENDWTYTFSDLAAYDSDGEAITYSVKEADLTGYTTTYSDVTGSISEGYKVTVTNTQIPTEDEDETPQTDDNSDIVMWLMLSIASVVMLAYAENKRKATR